jgi:multiple sugar transport system permease protein
MALGDPHHRLEHAAHGQSDVSGRTAIAAEELVEAAKVDGATLPQRIRRIIVPHLRPTIIVITLLSCFWTFNNFLYVWLTTAGGPGSYTNVIATEIYIKAFIEYQLGYSSAIGMFAAILMAAFGLVYLRVVARREFRDIF